MATKKKIKRVEIIDETDVSVSDNFFTDKEQDDILTYCEDSPYYWGELDHVGLPPVGMVHNIPEEHEIHKLVRNKIETSIPPIVQIPFYRMYVNMFNPHDNPFFHVDCADDSHGYTFLYYPQKDWNLNDGGETQFLIGENLYGITPNPNRMVMFDSRLHHKATAFRDRVRFTVAIKYEVN